MRIGVLALQGAFAEHIATLHQLKIQALPVRLPTELNRVDGLIIAEHCNRMPASLGQTHSGGSFAKGNH